MLSKKKVIKELNEEIIELNNEIDVWKNRFDKLDNCARELNTKLWWADEREKNSSIVIEDLKKHQVPNIKKIVCNEKKKTTVVFFDDEGKRIVKCAKGVKYDKYTAVAYAIVEKLFKSNSKFKRVVDKLEEK